MSDVQYFFRAADLVAVPYKEFEAQSGPGSMALSCYKPLIVSNVGALPELVREDVALVNPGDYKMLAENSSKILNSKELLKKLSDDSKYFAKKYSWDSVSKEFVKAYDLLEK